MQDQTQDNYIYEQSYEPCCRLGIIDSIELTDKRYKRVGFLVESFLKPGLVILAGAPKIGKSWMVLQLCMSIAKGEPFWGMPARQGTVLYIALEDSEQRMQERILSQTDEGSAHLKIAFECAQLGEGISEELRGFVTSYPDTRLIVIDTFQKVRMPLGQMSYAVDYAEISHLKNIADELGIAILLVHHTRKMADSDCFNEISGTNGIAGSADTLLVLKKEKRTQRTATLTCTGRDIEDREMQVELDRDSCVWKLRADSLIAGEQPFPEMLDKLVAFMKKSICHDGTNALFCERFSAYCGSPVDARQLKRLMNMHRFALEDHGVFFSSYRTSRERLIMIRYYPQRDIYADTQQSVTVTCDDGCDGHV